MAIRLHNLCSSDGFNSRCDRDSDSITPWIAPETLANIFRESSVLTSLNVNFDKVPKATVIWPKDETFIIKTKTDYPSPECSRVTFEKTIDIKNGETIRVEHDPIGNVAKITIKRQKDIADWLDVKEIEEEQVRLNNLATEQELEVILSKLSPEQLNKLQLDHLEASISGKTTLKLDEYVAKKQKLRDKVNEVITLRRDELSKCKCEDCIHSTFEQLRQDILSQLDTLCT